MMCDQPLPTEPQYLSKEQFYKKCHISKATALHLIESGLVPAIDLHRPTKRYLILSQDVDAYLLAREKDLDKYGYTFQLQEWAEAYGVDANKWLRDMIHELCEDKPDLLLADDVANLLGYRRDTVCRWCKRKKLKSFFANGIYHIPKQYLLEFVVSAEFYSIQPKSKYHIELLKKAAQLAADSSNSIADSDMWRNSTEMTGK